MVAMAEGVVGYRTRRARLSGGGGLPGAARYARADQRIVAALKKAPIVYKKAKDLLRASRLALLPTDNAHVAADLKKIKKGKQLSPILACAAT